MARLLALDVIGGKGLYEAECNELNDYYEALKCDCFDVTSRLVGGRKYDIFCDDVGTLVKNPIPSAFNSEEKPCLVGNLVFAKHNMEGDTISLTDEDIQHIKGCLRHVNVKIHGTGNYPDEWDIVYPVDYSF